MDCVFCSIASGAIPATIVASNGAAVAFRDLHPQAPVHILVIPVRHVASLTDLDPGEVAGVVGPMVSLAAEVAAGEGLASRGYRLVVNTGTDGGQTVPHLHIHLLGGRQMHWPPG